VPARLACVKPAASVRSEPGSNSHVEEIDLADHVILRRSLTIDRPALHSATRSVSSKRETRQSAQVFSHAGAEAPAARTNAVRVSLPQIQQCQRPVDRVQGPTHQRQTADRPAFPPANPADLSEDVSAPGPRSRPAPMSGVYAAGSPSSTPIRRFSSAAADLAASPHAAARLRTPRRPDGLSCASISTCWASR
jgi:hypothetical protein